MGGLDEAWAEAEAALPEGWFLGGLRPVPDPTSTPYKARLAVSGWMAGAVRLDWQDDIEADGPSPAAALRNLATALRAAAPAEAREEAE